MTPVRLLASSLCLLAAASASAQDGRRPYLGRLCRRPAATLLLRRSPPCGGPRHPSRHAGHAHRDVSVTGLARAPDRSRRTCQTRNGDIPMTHARTLEGLLDKDEIAGLVHAYCAHFDRAEAEAVAALFTDDAEIDYGPDVPTLHRLGPPPWIDSRELRCR